MKHTIALLGESYQRLKTLHQLAKRYRLLLVTKEENSLSEMETLSYGDVEVIPCAKEGCWEADMIMLLGEEIHRELLEKIREVATQKIVMVIHSTELVPSAEKYDSSLIRWVLPFSKVVEVSVFTDKAVVVGNDPAAVRTVEEVVQLSGYFVKN